jgi:hypothetical protein
MKVGTIRGRHEMPVDEYLVEVVEPGQAAYNAVFRAAILWRRRNPSASVHLYYTGLTEATLGALDGLSYERLGGGAPVLWRWDAATQTYATLRTGSAADATPPHERDGPPRYPSAREIRDDKDDTHSSVYR